MVVGCCEYSYRLDLVNLSLNTEENITVAQIIEVEGLKTPTTKTTTKYTKTIEPIIKVQVVEKAETRIKDSIIHLNSIALNKVHTNSKNIHLKHTETTFIQFNINTKKTKRIVKKDNPVEKLIGYTKAILKQNNLQIPVIEIDYKSLLTLNKKS